MATDDTHVPSRARRAWIRVSDARWPLGIACALLVMGATFFLARDRSPSIDVIPEANALKVNVSVPWALIDVRDSTIRVLVVGGGCTRFRELSAVESPGVVTITAFAREPAQGSNIDCTGDLRITPAEVSLAGRVGKRTLRHAPVVAHWQRYQEDVDTWARARRSRGLPS